MKFVLLNAATAKEEWAQLASQRYIEKISHFFSIEIDEAKGRPSSRAEKSDKIKEDSEALLKKIKADDFVVLFDERGQALSSEKFADKINQGLLSGKKRIVFVVGGAFGVDAKVVERANLKISLSNMVMNHLVAQVVVLEQIYRGLTILKNIPYHNQ